MRIRHILGVCLVGVVVLGSAVAADAGGDTLPFSKFARKQDGNFKHGVFQVNVAGAGNTKTGYLKLINQDDFEDASVLSIEEPPSDYKVKWFRGKTNISNDVYQELPQGYDFNLKAGKAKLFRFKIRSLDGSPTPECIGIRVAEPPNSVNSVLALNNDECA